MDLNSQLMSELSSYFPEGTIDSLEKRKNANKRTMELKDSLDSPLSDSAVLKKKKGEDEDLSLLSLQSNEAATKLLEKSGQVIIAKRMESKNREEQIARQETKEKKAVALKKKRKDDQAKKIPVAPLNPMSEAPKESVPLPLKMPDSLHIQNMEQHNRRAREVELFSAQVERPDKATTDMIIQTPSTQEALIFCHQFERAKACVEQYKETLGNNPNLTFQKIPVFSRQVLQTFLREPDPRYLYERPCFNLDREPVQGEARIRCVAHRLSEERLGPGQGYRLRELLFPDQIVAINHTLDVERKDPRRHLYPMQEMCYLCHIFLTNQMCLDQKNKAEERERKDLTASREERKTMYTIHNRFMVTFGTEGEYDLRRMLVSDNVAMGILGPFPMWSERHFQCCKVQPSNLRGFAENDILVFRLSREPSQQIESNNKNVSTQSTPTGAKPTITTFRQ